MIPSIHVYCLYKIFKYDLCLFWVWFQFLLCNTPPPPFLWLAIIIYAEVCLQWPQQTCSLSLWKFIGSYTKWQQEIWKDVLNLVSFYHSLNISFFSFLFRLPPFVTCSTMDFFGLIFWSFSLRYTLEWVPPA